MKCPFCGTVGSVVKGGVEGERYFCNHCGKRFNRDYLERNKAPYVPDEKELLICREAVLTNKKLIVEYEPIDFKNIIEVLVKSTWNLPKVLVRLSDGSTREFGVADTRSDLAKTGDFFWDLLIIN